jgi:hypothetical protein
MVPAFSVWRKAARQALVSRTAARELLEVDEIEHG